MADENDHVSPVEDARDHRPRPVVEIRTTKPYPLNSRRLTSPYLMCISRALGLPTNGTVEETRLMIEGKLTEMGREPRNVQVIVSVEDDVEAVSLQDGSGVFVRAGCPSSEASGGGAGGSREDRRTTVSANRESEDERSEHDDSSLADELAESRAHNEELTALNEDLSQEVSSLREEVSSLREQLGRETERAGEMWKANCAQVVAFDETITAKDAEIERFLAGVAVLEAPRGVGATTSSTTHAPTVCTFNAHVRSCIANCARYTSHCVASIPTFIPAPISRGYCAGFSSCPHGCSCKKGKSPSSEFIHWTRPRISTG